MHVYDSFSSMILIFLTYTSVTGSAAEDVQVEGERPINTVTRTQPCVVHANGWSKQALLYLVRDAHVVSANMTTPDPVAKANV